MKEKILFKSNCPVNGWLFMAFFMLVTSLSAQTGTKRKTNINGLPFEHQPRDVNKSLSNCDNSPYRTYDGTCNNQSAPDRTEWGATDIALRREVAANYGGPNMFNDMAGQNRPSPRAVSNACVAQPAGGVSASNLSSLVYSWGQFLDHDVDLTPTGSSEYYPVVLPANEPLFTTDIPFFRSEIHAGTGVNNPRQQSNLITSWIDASNIYGSEEERANWLRTFQDGKLKTSSGNLLPFNTIDGQYGSPIDPNAPSMAGADGVTKLFVAGDVRANEQVGLTTLHTLFVREHNRICDQLKQQGMTNDELMYQTARKWVGAYVQSITYREFLPVLGIQLKNYNGYKPNVQPDISNIFATAAYRLGHTMVTSELLLRNDQCGEVGVGSLSLVEAFFSVDPIREYNIAPFLKGLAVQTQMEVDNYVVDELRNFLFAVPGSPVSFGLDLASLNIQRGRDHGLPSYNAVRQAYGLSPVTTFSGINPNPVVFQALASVYNNVNDVDAWVGLLAENHLSGKAVGRTLDRILVNQFERLRDGDRFYYEMDNWFTGQEKDQIRNTRLGDIIKRNTDLVNLQPNVFIADNCSGPGGPNGPNGPNGPGGPGHGGGGHLNVPGGTTNRSNQEDGNVTDGMELLGRGMAVYPNPVSLELQVVLNAPATESVTLLVFDNRGSVVIQEKIVGFSGSLKRNLDFRHLSPGLYFVQAITSNDSFISKVVKE